jgi:putative Holliday junction resolvase
MSARYVGVDPGAKRIGLAISDPAGEIASPLKTVTASSEPTARVREVIEATDDFDVDEWVVGLPLNMDGTAGAAAESVRAFASALAEATGHPVHLWDERLSSHEADERMARTGLTHKQKKRRRDALAAQVILQSYLDAATGTA